MSTIWPDPSISLQSDNEICILVSAACGYEFNNWNLMRQAFTRRAYAIEHGLDGCSEQLEYIGDRVLSFVVTRVMVDEYGKCDSSSASPFGMKLDEGQMSKINSKLTCKEYLAKRADFLGLSGYVLYGTGETETESAKEDMMEALLGAIAIDSKWDYEALEDAVYRLLDFHLDGVVEFLSADPYELLNAWHQRHFRYPTQCTVFKENGRCYCRIRYRVDAGAGVGGSSVRLEAVGEADTRSRARAIAADKAILYLKRNGLWLDLAGCGIEPCLDMAVNQLQDLYQKKYVTEPSYSFEDTGESWKCKCCIEGFMGEAMGSSKAEAKKKAAFDVLKSVFS